MRHRVSEHNLLDLGIYTVPEAAELIDAPTRMVRIWATLTLT
jgi:hypothetical protein